MTAPTYADAVKFLAGFVADWQRTPFQGITNESTDGQRLLAVLRVLLDRVADLSGRDANGLARKLADKHDEILTLKAEFEEFADRCAVHSADRCVEQVAAEDEIAALKDELAKQRAVNKSAAKAFMDGSAQLNAELGEANRRAQAACDQRDGALAELAELRTVRRCGLPGAHPAHGWFFARKILRCPGVESAEAQAPAATAPEGADGGPEGGLQRAGTAKADSDAGGGPKVPQNAPTGFCPECGTAQPLDHRDRITGHGAPDADCADWCGGSWNHPASAETTHQ